MDYKEKYEQALEKARKEYKNLEAFNDFCKMLVHIFPELNESEDEKTRKELIEQVAYIVPNDDEVDSEGNVLPTYQKRIDKYHAWLEKQAEQKPAEWSEEDKKMFVNIKACLRNANKDYSAELDWLKSLKPQKQWKPSEEQMDALDYYANSLCTYCDRQNDLRSLYNDLKKL